MMDGELTERPYPVAKDLATAPTAGASSSDELIDLRGVLRVLLIHKWVIAGSALAMMLVAWVLVSQVTPQYEARALVMLNNRTSNVVNMDSVVAGIEIDNAAIATEVEIIRSEKLLERVVDKLRLDQAPEFNSALKDEGEESFSMTDAVAALLGAETAALLGLGAEAEESEPGDSAELTRRRVVEAVASRLSAEAVGLSYVISIEFTSADPDLAALVANTVADQYIIDQLEAKFEATRRASSWLSERLQTLREDVETAEARVEAFRVERAVVDGQGAELTRQQLAQLNSAMIQARANLAEVEARNGQVQAAAESGAAGLLESRLIQSLREQEASARRRQAELAIRYGDKHPRMINARAELSDIRAAIRAESQKIRRGISNELSVARARLSALQDEVRTLEQKKLVQSQSSVELNQLVREAAATKAIYESFLARFKETSQQEDIQQADAREISEARAPVHPSEPRKKLMTALGGAFGLMLGVAFAFLREGLNNSFRSASQLESETGLPVLAQTPLQRGVKKREQLLDFVSAKPNSLLAEAVRNLRTALLLANVDRTPKVVLITSAVPNEGKSSIALMLAAITARMGKKALLIDCDMRRPSVADLFNAPKEASLVDVLSGKTTVQEATLQPEAIEGLSVR
ncbi:MAG: polysaccharide biosynthesis tyrosine autokinase [Pseudomonadota bacterium]